MQCTMGSGIFRTCSTEVQLFMSIESVCSKGALMYHYVPLPWDYLYKYSLLLSNDLTNSTHITTSTFIESL